METPFFIETSDAPAKREILVAALKLFTEKGLCETSIRHIAAESGYTNPALYKHFAGKDALALELFERCYRWVMGKLISAIEREQTAHAKMQVFLRSYLEMVDEDLEVLVYINENLQTFWPHVSEPLRQRTLVTLVREIVVLAYTERHESPGENLELWVVAIVGIFGQIARMTFLKALSHPASKHFATYYQILCRLL